MAIGKKIKKSKFEDNGDSTNLQLQTEDLEKKEELQSGRCKKSQDGTEGDSYEPQGNRSKDSKIGFSTSKEGIGPSVQEEKKTSKTTGVHPGNIGKTILIRKDLKSDTALLWDEIMNGVNGKNSGIPMGFNRLNKYLGLRKSIYTLIGAGTGIGKTAFVDCAYVLNPYDWFIKNKDNPDTKVKFEVVYFSMERKKTYKLAKWLCMKIWKEEGVLITVDELLSWGSKLSPQKQEMANHYLKYFEEMIESGIVKIIDGSINPTGIYKYLKANALAHGREEEKNEYEKIYVPNDDNLITNVVQDHIGCIKRENISGSYDKKANIDKLSEYNRIVRDLYHYSPIAISQFNRTSYADIQQAKKEGAEPEPTLEYFKDSGNTTEDADVILTLFNPLRYSIKDYMDYEIPKFVNPQTGNFYFRSLKILKNSYGTSDVRIGMAFLGEIGLFKELPKANQITDYEYNQVVNNSFFA